MAKQLTVMNILKNEEKVFERKTIIRFADCDPFNHLNNGRYFDYFMNAREDHLLKYHGFNLYQFAQDKGISWVVAQNQIAYLRPAKLMETVVIQTTITEWKRKSIRVEMRMWNHDKTVLIALMWSDFTHVNLQTQRSINHSEELNAFFLPYVNTLPAEHDSFEERVAFLRTKSAIELDHPFSHYELPGAYRLAIAV